MVTYGGEQSLDRYLAISARGVPFNIAHAAGNAALALVAGPAMVRMLLRYRRRFEFAWKRAPVVAGTGGAAAGIVCLIVALLIAGTVALPGQRADAAGGGAGAGAAWLRTAQNDDGGFGVTPGVDSSAAMTGWAVLGLEAAGINPLDLDHGDATPISYLAGNIGEITTTGDIERTILRPARCRPRPAALPGPRPGRAACLARRGKDGSWGGQVNPTAFGIFALQAAGSRPGAMGDRRGGCGRTRTQDGGWGFAAGASSDADSTGAVLQGLAASGSTAGIRRGNSYLRGAQRPGGGFAAERRGGQRAVHRLGGPGPGRGGRLAGLGGPQWRSLPARLPRLRPGRRWPLPLLGLERPDAGLGHRPGPAGGQRRPPSR